MLEIHEQPWLPFYKQVEICADGIRHRLFRSAVTLAMVALAIAFLMNILAESAVARSCKRGVAALNEPRREWSAFLAFFDGPLDRDGLLEHVIASPADAWRAQAL